MDEHITVTVSTEHNADGEPEEIFLLQLSILGATWQVRQWRHAIGRVAHLCVTMKQLLIILDIHDNYSFQVRRSIKNFEDIQLRLLDSGLAAPQLSDGSTINAQSVGNFLQRVLIDHCDKIWFCPQIMSFIDDVEKSEIGVVRFKNLTKQVVLKFLFSRLISSVVIRGLIFKILSNIPYLLSLSFSLLGSLSK